MTRYIKYLFLLASSVNALKPHWVSIDTPQSKHTVTHWIKIAQLSWNLAIERLGGIRALHL